MASISVKWAQGWGCLARQLWDRRIGAADEAHWGRPIVPLACEVLDEASGLRARQRFSLSEILCSTLGYL